MNNTQQNAFIETLKQNQRLLLIAGPIALTMFVIILAIIFMQPKQGGNQTNQNSPETTLTPKPVADAKELDIITVSPQNNATGITIYTPITITFAKSIPKSVQSSIKIETSPFVAGTYSWSSDNKTLTYTPVGSFASQSIYSTSVTASGEKYTWRFQTVTNASMSQEDIMRAEKESADFTKAQDEAFDKNYPWWNSFPLQTEQYFVYYDPNARTFVGLLYPKRSASTSIDAQVAASKNEITTQITNLGINVNQYGGISWKINPEP